MRQQIFEEAIEQAREELVRGLIEQDLTKACGKVLRLLNRVSRTPDDTIQALINEAIQGKRP